MTLSKWVNVQWFLRYQTQPASAGEVNEAAQVVPNVRWSLHQVCSSIPCSYSFTSTNGSLCRLRSCRLCRLCHTLGPSQAANWFAVVHGGTDALQEGWELNSPEQRLAGHVDWNKWHVEMISLGSWRISGRLAFICLFVCLFVDLKEEGVSVRMKSRTKSSLKWCWQALGVFLTLPKHPRLYWQ